MEEWITQLIEELGYFGLFLVMVLENLFPPIPSELVLPFGGFMTTRTNLTLVGVTVVTTTGSVLGAILLYGLGRLVDKKRLETIAERWGHVLRVSKGDIQRANKWFDRYGIWTICFCRMIPLVRSLVSIPAGMAHMNLALFLLFTVLGTASWNIILVALGAVFGETWPIILPFIQFYSTLVYGVIIALLLCSIIWYLHRQRRS